VEIKIGVQSAPRELVLEVALTAEELRAAIDEAVGVTAKSPGVLDLVDERGRRVLVPGSKIAYVEMGEPEVRRVGFGAM
jgi:hypothetical protein